MKKIIKYLLIFVIGGAFLSACEFPDTNFESMYKDYDKNNSTFFVQLTTAEASYETAIDENGLPEDIPFI